MCAWITTSRRETPFIRRYSYKRNQPHAIDSGVPPEYAGYREQYAERRLAAISDTWTI